MKLGISSDLHLDFADINPEFYDWRGDVLLLAGDLAEEDYLRKHGYVFLDNVSRMATWVLVIAGNHEFYGSELDTAEDHLDVFFEQWPNIILLRNSSFTYENIDFFGGTMWTDYQGSPIAGITASMELNDFKQIRIKYKDYKKIIPPDIIHENQKSKNALLNFLDSESPNKKVVMTHHAPSMQSVPANYRHAYELNKAYCNRFDSLIEANPKINTWAHGHCHSRNEYVIGKTRIICNARGYPGEFKEIYRPYTFYL